MMRRHVLGLEDLNAASGDMKAFLNEVEAQRGRHLTETAADFFSRAANIIVEAIK